MKSMLTDNVTHIKFQNELICKQRQQLEDKNDLSVKNIKRKDKEREKLVKLFSEEFPLM